MGNVRLLTERDTAAFNIIGERDFNRYLRLLDPDLPSKEFATLLWKISSNQIVRLRRDTRKEISYLRSLYSERSQIIKQLNIEKANRFKNKFEIRRLESFVQSLNVMVKATQDILAALGELVNTALKIYNLVATDHDIAQLVGANMQEVERCRKDHEESGEPMNTFFTDLIFVYQAESEEGQPLFTAMYQRFTQELRRNKGLRQAYNEELGKIDSALKRMPRYQAHRDALGNQVAEQVYQPLELV